MKPVINDIKVIYCSDVKILARNISEYRGEILNIVKIQGDHGQGSFKLSAQFTYSNSVNQLEVLAVTDESGESILTIRSIIDLVRFHRPISLKI